MSNSFDMGAETIGMDTFDAALDGFDMAAQLILWAAEVGPALEEAVKSMAPVRTGILQAQIGWKQEISPVDAIVSIGVEGASVSYYDGKSNPANYVNFVIKGTEPFIISADGSGTAHYMGEIPEGPKGDVPYITQRQGQASNPFHIRALEAMKPFIMERTLALLRLNAKL